MGEALGLGCLEFDVVGDLQRLNPADELFAFGVIVGELIETSAEGIQLEADTLAANTVGGEVVHRNVSGGKCPHLGNESSFSCLHVIRSSLEPDTIPKPDGLGEPAKAEQVELSSNNLENDSRLFEGRRPAFEPSKLQLIFVL